MSDRRSAIQDHVSSAYRKYQRLHGRGGRCITTFPVADVTEIMMRHQVVDHGELTVQTELVRAILRELDEETRAVMAFHVDGFKSIEIANLLGLTDQKARDLTKKGRKALKAGLAALREQDRRQVR